MPNPSMNASGDAPTVSVLASSYNHERWILDTLESIRAQTFQDFELIYADDASSDRSVELATAWLRDRPFPVRTVIHRANRGVCRTFNEALALCRGRYLQIVSCDDILFPEKLARQVDMLDKASEDVALVHSGGEVIDAEGAIISEQLLDSYPVTVRKLNTEFPDQPFEQMLKGSTICAASVLVKTNAIRSVGGWDENLRYEDWDMWLRLSRSWRFLFSPYVSAAYRQLETGLHTRPRVADKYWTIRKHVDMAPARLRLMWVAYEDLYEKGELTPEIRCDFLDCVQRFPDMRNIRNHLIRWNIPPALYRQLLQAKSALSRASRAWRRDALRGGFFRGNDGELAL